MGRINYYKLGIIGCGNMAEAILRGIFSSGFLKYREVFAYDIKPEKVEYIKSEFKICASADIKSIVKKSRHILIAVKPRDISKLLDELKIYFNPVFNSLISIVAGVTTNFYERILKGEASVIRVMPNTPALLNCGMTVLSSGNYVRVTDLDFATDIFKNLGECIILDEKLQNAATAISGSGPAYFFLFCKFLIESAIKAGIKLEVAQTLVLNTISGSAEMLKKFNADYDNLIKMVASPGGTTEAALAVFEKKKIGNIIDEAVVNAIKRAESIQGIIESGEG